MYPTQYRSIVEQARADTRKLVRVDLVPASRLAESASASTTTTTTTSPPNQGKEGAILRSVRGDADASAKVAIVTMDDPATLNALSPTLMIQLRDTLEDVARNPDIKCVVLTGADPAFCSGGQLELIKAASTQVHTNSAVDRWDPDAPYTPGGGTAEPWRFIRMQFGSVVRLITNSNALFVAAVNGPAAGVGMAFALACDAVIASKERARIVPAFGRLGLLPEVGTSWAVTRKLGYQGAFAFFMEGQPLDADAALRLGLVQRVVPHAELIPASLSWCARMLSLPPHTVEMTKTLLRSVSDLPFEPALRMEELAEANVFSTRALPLAAELIRGGSAAKSPSSPPTSKGSTAKSKL